MPKTNPNNLRYFDVHDEPVQVVLTPIEGYESYALLPLHQAIASLAERVIDLDAHACIALQNCKNPKDQLSSDESAAIHLYTMEWEPRENSLYVTLNKSLRAESRTSLKPWFFYLKLILTALYKLPSEKRTVWRGVREDLSRKYPQGHKFAWWGFSSCTESIQVLQSAPFLGTTGTRTLFSIECFNAKSIRNHSFYSQENELLLLPGIYLEVKGQLKQDDGLTIIHLKEIEPTNDLLKPPFPIQQEKNKTGNKALSRPVVNETAQLSNKMEFCIDALSAINMFRRWHQAPALNFSEYLATLATEKARKFAETGFIQELEFVRSRVKSQVRFLAIIVKSNMKVFT